MHSKNIDYVYAYKFSPFFSFVILIQCQLQRMIQQVYLTLSNHVSVALFQIDLFYIFFYNVSFNASEVGIIRLRHWFIFTTTIIFYCIEIQLLRAIIIQLFVLFHYFIILISDNIPLLFYYGTYYSRILSFFSSILKWSISS